MRATPIAMQQIGSESGILLSANGSHVVRRTTTHTMKSMMT